MPPSLYTDMRALKLAMNGGVMPPMTPLPPGTPDWIDPAFVPGLGALSEDETRGVRCPVRGCGQWRHALMRHLNTTHRDIGGAEAVRKALGIPRRASLSSLSFLETARRRGAASHVVPRTRPLGGKCYDKDARLSAMRETFATMGFRNLSNTCDAQVSHRLIDLRNEIGRSPSRREAMLWRFGGGRFVRAIERVYGSFEAAVLAHGWPPRRKNESLMLGRAAVLESLRVWHAVHGSLPSSKDVQSGTRAPRLPAVRTVTKNLGTESWPEAMRRAAALLNIYGGRYGLPESARPKDQRAAA